MGNDREGYLIGFQELYDAITRMDSKMDERHTSDSVRFAQHDMRLAQLEAAQAKRWERFSLWAAVVLSPIASVLASYYIHH